MESRWFVFNLTRSDCHGLHLEHFNYTFLGHTLKHSTFNINCGRLTTATVYLVWIYAMAWDETTTIMFEISFVINFTKIVSLNPIMLVSRKSEAQRHWPISINSTIVSFSKLWGPQSNLLHIHENIFFYCAANPMPLSVTSKLSDTLKT